MTRWLALVALAACHDTPGVAPAPGGKVELIAAPKTDDVARLVAPEVTRARRDGKQLVVYVGAAWCEPCNRFHAAAEAGELDAGFGDLRFLVFDHDRDRDALERAGYLSELIPLFAIPRENGVATARKIEGSIKGDGAVEQIGPRLRHLVDGI